MNTFDALIVGLGLLGLFFWVRGLARRSTGDCAFGLVLAVVACALYFFLFSLTRTPWLAAILLGTFLLLLLPFRQRARTPGGWVYGAALIILTAAAAIAEQRYVSTGNALLVIEPYRTGAGWAFDEPRVGLRAEPFVQGIPEMIDRLVEGIPGSDESVRLIFSQRPFPGAQLRLDRRKEQDGGNWYYCEEYQAEGWLCPALFKFFPRAPQHIHVMAEQR